MFNSLFEICASKVGGGRMSGVVAEMGGFCPRGRLSGGLLSGGANVLPSPKTDGLIQRLQAAVIAKCSSATSHWSSSARPHHASTETASLAACKATNWQQLQSHSTGLQVSSQPHPAISVGRLPTRLGGSALSRRPHLHSPSDTDTVRR